MANTHSDKLHRLVDALTPTEKRYFRLFIRGKTDRESKYLALFDHLAGGTESSEEELSYMFYGDQPGANTKYAELKAYLYNLILKSLKQFDENEHAGYRVNFYVESLQVLYKRGLYRDCQSILQKAHRLAVQYELFGHQIELIRWEKQLAYTRMDVAFLYKHLDSLQLREQKILAQLENEVNFRQIFFQVYTLIKREAQLDTGERTLLLDKLVKNNPDFQSEKALSHRARVLYLRILNLYYFALSDYEKIYETGQQLIGLLESQPLFLKESKSDIIAAINNHILACGLLKKYDEVRANLLKLLDIQPLTHDDQIKIHRQYFSNIFALCIFTGEFEEGLQEMERYHAVLRDTGADKASSASFYFQFCCISFGAGDYDGALHYLNAWMNEPRSVAREDLQRVARILSLIIHYEMGNDLLLDSLTRAATRFLQKKNRLLELERQFIHLMTALIRASDTDGRRAAFEQFSTRLKVLATKPAARSVLQTFDLEAWLDSKLQHISFSAAVKAKFQNRLPGREANPEEN